MSGADTYPVEAVLRSRSGKAILVEIDGEEHWLPTSVVGEHEDADLRATIVVEIPEWLLDARGIY